MENPKEKKSYMAMKLIVYGRAEEITRGSSTPAEYTDAAFFEGDSKDEITYAASYS